ncbi:MAG: B12-binding domain-containing radical SAM protein, partial [Candidatus Omnitrophica bacterium]|nr:B12-binding domain-containing radical SAM protein [Candidatus Omnitrophota bacterium]
EIDYLIIGEAEIPLPEFIRAFQEKDKKFNGIKSIGYRQDGRVFIDKTRQFVKDIDSIPLPARHLIKNELYANILTRKKNFTAMLSSRGCPYQCAFCDQKIPLYRVRSARNFVDEIKYNYERFGIREFDIYDSTFTANRKRVIDICDLIKEEKIDISWTIRSRIDSVNESVLDALKSSGCHTIMYGIESSDPKILERMRKGISTDLVRKIVSYTKKIGMDTLGFFMFGFPGETKETIEKTIQFSLELPLDYVQYSVLVPFADTEIYEYYMDHGLGDYWSRYTLDPAQEHKIELIEIGLSRNEIAKYVSMAYRKFYFRPRIILRRAMNIRSASELKRLSRGACGLLKNSFFMV